METITYRNDSGQVHTRNLTVEEVYEKGGRTLMACKDELGNYRTVVQSQIVSRNPAMIPMITSGAGILVM